MNYDSDFNSNVEKENDAVENIPSKESPFAPGWSIIVSQKIPSSGQHIGQLIKNQILTETTREPYLDILEKMEYAESQFFGDKTNPFFCWNTQYIAETFRKSGFKVLSATQIINEKRRISQKEIQRWFNTESSAYGRAMVKALGVPDLQKLIDLLENAVQNQIFNWQTETGFFTISENT